MLLSLPSPILDNRLLLVKRVQVCGRWRDIYQTDTRAAMSTTFADQLEGEMTTRSPGVFWDADLRVVVGRLFAPIRERVPPASSVRYLDGFDADHAEQCGLIPRVCITWGDKHTLLITGGGIWLNKTAWPPKDLVRVQTLLSALFSQRC